jgi:hypothetical protein
MLLCLEPVVCKGISNEMVPGWRCKRVRPNRSSRQNIRAVISMPGPDASVLAPGSGRVNLTGIRIVLDEVTDFVPQS